MRAGTRDRDRLIRYVEDAGQKSGVVTGPSQQDAGFTLIEVVISLALFALISIGGLALIDAIIRVEERTSGRIERLGQLQRAMFMLTRDLEQISGGTLEEAEAGIRFERHAASREAGRAIRYTLRGDSLFREVGGTAPSGTSQLLLSGVSSASWTFFFSGRGWLDELPAGEGDLVPQPAAVAIDILLEGGAPSGSLRRVVELPTPPFPEQPL